ncbi:MAG: hypothetical protein NHB32_15140 [Fischerella sp. CENA71]|nr:hypothetical protein [Fischerella sp. CENA71]
MITSLSTEDNLQLTNSIQQSSLILSNKIKNLVENLNKILNYNNTNIIIHEIKECTDFIREFNLKYEDPEKPLEKIKLIRDFRNNLKNFIIKRQEYTTDEVVGELINESLANLTALEKSLKEAEHLQITIAYLEAIKNSVDDKLSWLQNLYSSMLYILEILEDEDIILIPKSVLKTIENTSEYLSSNKGLRDYIKTSKSDENQEKIRTYINSIRHVAKATLWELQKLKQEQPNLQSLLNFIQSSPEWKGDDFEECLDFINEERRK